MTISEVFDLTGRDGRHQNAKVVSLCGAVGTFALLLLIVLMDRTVSWPLAALIGAFLFGPMTVDVIKALAKIRWGAPSAPSDSPPR